MYCSKCGTPNSESARFCEKCGMVLGATAAAAAGGGSTPGPPPPPSIAPGAFQPQQQPAYYADPRVRGAAQVPTAPGIASSTPGKSPAVAVLLSFLIPGVGQFYAGDNKKGGIMLAAYLVSWLLTGFVIGFIGVVGVWVWSMIDAYNLASGKTPIS